VSTRQEMDDELKRQMHRTIRKVSQDIEVLSFNTAISALMIYVNTLYTYHDKSAIHPEALDTLVLLLSPFAPHVSEECWEMMGHRSSLAYHPWPKYDEGLCEKPEDALIKLGVQVNGKLRGTIDVAANADEAVVLDLALNNESIARFVEVSKIVKKIYIPGKILNFVVKK
jgi:leucyl-tRNA synthetase